MKPNLTHWTFALALSLSACLARADDPKPTLKTLGIGPVVATKALQDSMTRSGQTGSLAHLIDSLNEHLLVTFQNTRKFDIISRGDLSTLLKEQNLPSGLITDPSDAKALPGKIRGLDYLLLTSITDLKDAKVGANIEGQGIRVERRDVQATAIVKIYNTTTGSLMQSIILPVSREEHGAARISPGVSGNGAPDDSLIETLVLDIASKSAQQIVDIVFPARVLAITDGVVTINRGEGSGVAPNQTWEVFALGEELKDPDTGVSLGREEVRMGEIVIDEVLNKMSKGHVMGENRGIDRGAVVRPKVARPLGAPAR